MGERVLPLQKGKGFSHAEGRGGAQQVLTQVLQVLAILKGGGGTKCFHPLKGGGGHERFYPVSRVGWWGVGGGGGGAKSSYLQISHFVALPLRN